MRAALYSLDHCALWRSRRPARISRRTDADHGDRRSAAAASVIVADVGPPSSKAAHFENTMHGMSSPGRCNARRSAASECVSSVEPRSSHLSLPARHLSCGKARPPILEFLARMIEVRRSAISIATHVFSAGPARQRQPREYRNHRCRRPCGRPRASAGRELRTRRGLRLNATNSCRPRGTRPRALAPREGIDAAPNACVYLPFLLADKMCKDATCISDCMH
jgi:hypothetical protein